MFEVDEDLHDLAEVLRGELVDEAGADFFREELVEGGLEALVHGFRVLEVVVEEEVELVEEVADVDAAEGVHLGKGEDAGEGHFVDAAVGRVPGYVDDFFVLLGVLDWHGHVVVCGDDLEEVVAKAAFEQLGVLVE